MPEPCVDPLIKLDRELRCMALTRVLVALPRARADCGLDRQLAFMSAGLWPVSNEDNAEALRRLAIHRTLFPPRAEVVGRTGAPFLAPRATARPASPCEAA